MEPVADPGGVLIDTDVFVDHLRGAARLQAPIDRPVAERAGRLRRDTGIAIADALVAATALEHGLSLMTRNAADFGRVHGLHIRAPR